MASSLVPLPNPFESIDRLAPLYQAEYIGLYYRFYLPFSFYLQHYRTKPYARTWEEHYKTIQWLDEGEDEEFLAADLELVELEAAYERRRQFEAEGHSDSEVYRLFRLESFEHIETEVVCNNVRRLGPGQVYNPGEPDPSSPAEATVCLSGGRFDLVQSVLCACGS